MGILQKMFGGQSKAIRQPFVQSVQTLYGSVMQRMFGKTDFVGEYKNWPYACISARADDVANIDLQLFRGDEEIEEHPILDLIKRVNPTMTKHDLFSATQTFKDLEGNCYWFLAREEKADNMGEVKEIYVLRPDKMNIVLNKENPLVVEGYIYTQDGGTKIPFAPSEIIHHKNFNPRGNHPFPHKGMGVVEAAWAAINTDNEMRKYNTAFFNNSARPDGILTTQGDSQYAPEEYKRLKEQWSEEHRGSDNAYKTAILGGGMKWEEISRSQADMQFIDQLHATRDEILALFRVPKSIIGITDDVNRANADAAIYVFSLKTIKPLMQKIVDTMNEFLVPAFGEEDLEFRFKSPVADDKDAVRADNEAGIDKWITRNEVRASMGLPPTVNGDSIFGTINQVAIDNTSPEKSKSAAKPTSKKRATSKKLTTSEELVEKFRGKLPKAEGKGVKQVSALAKTQYIELWKNHLNISAAPFKKKLITYFEKQEAQVQRNLKQELKGLEAKEYKLKGIKDIIFDQGEAVDAGISLITPFIKDYIKRAGEQATILTGGASFDTETQMIQQFIPKRAEYFAETINQTTADDLMSTIQDGIDNSESLEEISARIAEVYGKATDYRTDMIARTEVSASSNFGAKSAYVQAGVEKWEWAVTDPKDEDCAENEGAIVVIGDAFPDGDTEPPVHPNCECTTLPVFNDDSSDDEE